MLMQKMIAYRNGKYLFLTKDFKEKYAVKKKIISKPSAIIYMGSK
jgi:hypothetical protein